MTRPDESHDAFLTELLAQEGPDALDALSVAAVGSVPAPSVPAPSIAGRARLLAAATLEGRFARFEARVAALLDVSRETARKLLDLIDRPEVWLRPMPGVSLFWVGGGPRMEAALCGFLRVAPGKVFPEHEHIGDETVLVLQGTLLDPDSGERFGPGELDQRALGSRHIVAVPEDGLDLLMLAVVHGGLRVNGVDFTPANVVRRDV